MIQFILITLIAYVLAQDQQDWSVRCPERCQCLLRYSDRFQSHLRTVDCSNTGLSMIPDQVPIDTQSLILRRNHIRRPFETKIWLPELLHLDLSHNHVATLDDESNQSTRRTLFDGIYNLRVLDLSRNQITNLENGALEGLFNLHELNLSENRLARMGDDAFRGLFKLETLKLSSNRLAYVQSTWWHHIRTLYDLSLDGNYLNVLQSDTFDVLRNLVTLDLSKNKLFRINDHALNGLHRLENLYLQSNSLTSLNRDALKSVRNTLKSINLGRNPIAALGTDDFSNLVQLKDVSMNGMPRLRVIERGSFKNLPELLIVELHDNPYLAYVDAAAFVNTPEITHLLLHNNNLTVLEREVADSLPSLEEISFYGNPLWCDCNAKWMHDLLNTDGRKKRRINLPEFDRLVCDSPAEHRFKLFAGLRSIDFGDKCIRMLDNLFDSENERKIGDDITYRCRAIGIPKPKLVWTANRDAIDAGQYHPRRVLYNGDTLIVRRIKPEDSGSYVCTAQNEAGTRAVNTRLQVAEIKIQLHTLRIGSTTAALSWNGTDRENHVFQILFRRSAEFQRQYAATVTPIMKTYTVYNLQPNTDYEACITLVDGEEVVVNISCTRFKTGQLESAYRRIERTGNVAVGAALGIVSCMLIIVCLAAVVFKRSRSIVDTKRPASVDRVNTESQYRLPTRSLDNVSNITFCSIDNLYSPLLIGSPKNDTNSGTKYVLNSKWDTLINIDQDDMNV